MVGHPCVQHRLCQGRQNRIQARNRGSKHTRHHEAAQTFGQSRCHKDRQDAVALLLHQRQSFTLQRMSGVPRGQCDPHPGHQQPHEYRHRASCHGQARFAHTATTQDALGHQLVDTVRTDVAEACRQQRSPEGVGLRGAGIEVEDARSAALHSVLPQRAHATVKAADDPHEHRCRGGHKGHEQQHIRPHDRDDAAQPSPHHGNECDEADRQRDAGHTSGLL